MAEAEVRYRLTWEMVSPFDPTRYEWRATSREAGEDGLPGLVAQYTQLLEWERTGEEAIRNVQLAQSKVQWLGLSSRQLKTALKKRRDESKGEDNADD